MVVIPNSVVSKAIVTNHSRPIGPHRCIVGVQVDLAVAPARVIDALKRAATGCADLAHGTAPQVHACGVPDSVMRCELAFPIDSFALTPGAKSAMLTRIADLFNGLGIYIGAPATDTRIIAETG
jgi:small-conductance mechanosensitive channel